MRPVVSRVSPAPPVSRPSLRSIAVLEAAKGVTAVVAASGFLLHGRAAATMRTLAAYLQLDPEPGGSGALRYVTTGVFLYAAIRLVEAVGLWYDRRWAAWLGTVSAAIYLPLEGIELIRRPSLLTISLIAVTLAVIVVLTRRLVAAGSRASGPAADTGEPGQL